MSATRRVRVRVHGRVQGVWYRQSARREADELGVAGWVRNAGDGSVEAVLEGAPAAVERMLAWCRRGPERARVDAVEVREEPPAGARGFEVR